MTWSLAPLECPDAVCFVFLPPPVQRTERFAVRVASAYIHLRINASFYFKMLSEK